MDNHLPFGYEHRQKRSHDMMDGNAGPAWSFENLAPFARLGVPREHSVPRPQEPSHSNRHGSSPNPNYYLAGHRARTPDAATMWTRYSASREPTAQANNRTPSAGPANRRAEHFPHTEQLAQNMEGEHGLRFEGDGFDMRRPAGLQSRAEGVGRTEERHMVEISDGEDNDLILVDDDVGEDGDDIAAHNTQVEREQRNSEDVVDLTEEDDAPPFYNWDPRNDRQAHGYNRPQPHPPSAGRRLNNDAPRLPRGMDGIINLDNGDEVWAVDDEPPVVEPSSPEVQFVSVRRLDPPNRAVPPPRRNDSEGDDVQFVQERTLTEQERRARLAAAQHAELDQIVEVLHRAGGHRHTFAHLRGQIDQVNAHIGHLAENMQRGGPQPPPRLRRAGHIRMGIAGGAGAGMFVPPNLNFGVVGFDLEYGRRREAPTPPTYEAPPTAPEGFTRSPEEDEVLVCPNCASELCKGDDDVKKQVWIAKQCGHIYCGECAANRLAKKSAKGKEKQGPPKTRPFKECVVEGCGKKVSSSKAMFQIFML